jgi:hypothetical protein
MTTTPPPQLPVIELTAAEIARFIRASIAKTFRLAKKSYKVQTEASRGHLEVLYQNGPPLSAMQALVSKYQRRFDRTGGTFTEEDDQHVYISRYMLTISCSRSLSSDFVRRCAQVHCRRVQKALPEILDGRIQTRDAQLKQEIEVFIAGLDERELLALEREAEALPPLPELSAGEARVREREAERRRTTKLQAVEIKRQQQLFCLTVYQSIGASEQVSKILDRLAQLERQVRLLAPVYENPAVCSFCFAVGEARALQRVGDYSACPSCIAQETALLTPEDVEGPQHSPSEAVEAPPLLPQDAEPAQLRYEDGIYYATNGEVAPLLTRDLLQEIRFGTWWLAFEQKPDDAVRTALRQAGWDWSNQRRQWYHPNKFGVVPPVIFEVYGGYVDAGFSVYRELRGERLRHYADRSEEKAEREWTLSNEVVRRYMSTGVLVVGPGRSRSHQKKKQRAETLAQAAKECDRSAHDLRERANRSETHQQRVTRTGVLLRVIKRLEAEVRKEERAFHEMVFRAARVYNDPHSDSYRDLSSILAAYEEVERRKEIVEEEIAWLRAVVEERRAMAATKEVTAPPQDIPTMPQRVFAVEQVVEVNVGAENRLDLYPTPSVLGARLLKDAALFPIPSTARYILEPHGGTGSLLRCIQRYMGEHAMQAEIHTCELNWQLREELQRQGYQVVGSDFCDYWPGDVRYDAIVANPPFSSWIIQVRHMLELLAEGGTLNVILPRSFFSDKPEVKAFRKYVEENGAYIEIERGAFKESGTDVPVVLVSLQN